MKLQHVKSFEGSPRPSDIFEHHMPGVELLSDMDEVFHTARKVTFGKQPAEVGEYSGEKLANGQRAVAVVTPGRLIMSVPAPKPGSMPNDAVAPMRLLMPPDPPLNISVISYTYVEALIGDKMKAIPFLGLLTAFAYIGHTVVVFEGHPSAFESGVRGSDVLLVDSGMLPFMQSDWKEVAFSVMRPGAKLLIHDRETFTLSKMDAREGESGPVPPKPQELESEYANLLLWVLVIGSRSSAQVTSGEEPPNLADFVTEPEPLERIASLPFRHYKLDADKIIDAILQLAARRWYHFKSWTFKLPVLFTDGKARWWTYSLTLTKDAGGRRRLLVER